MSFIFKENYFWKILCKFHKVNLSNLKHKVLFSGKNIAIEVSYLFVSNKFIFHFDFFIFPIYSCTNFLFIILFYLLQKYISILLSLVFWFLSPVIIWTFCLLHVRTPVHLVIYKLNSSVIYKLTGPATFFYMLVMWGFSKRSLFKKSGFSESYLLTYFKKKLWLFSAIFETFPILFETYFNVLYL